MCTHVCVWICACVSLGICLSVLMFLSVYVCVCIYECLCKCTLFCHLKKYSSYNFKFILSKSKDKNNKIFSNRRHSITEVVVPGSRIVNLFSYALSSILYNKGPHNLSVKIRGSGSQLHFVILGQVFGQAQ